MLYSYCMFSGLDDKTKLPYIQCHVCKSDYLILINHRTRSLGRIILSAVSSGGWCSLLFWFRVITEHLVWFHVLLFLTQDIHYLNKTVLIWLAWIPPSLSRCQMCLTLSWQSVLQAECVHTIAVLKTCMTCNQHINVASNNKFFTK